MNKTIIIIITLMLTAGMHIRAQGGIDPIRAATITAASEKAVSVQKAQNIVQTTLSAGHIWDKEEMEATVNFQKEFNDYLDKFHNVLGVIAELYGVYYEITQTAANIKEVEKALETEPTNAIALAFSAKKGKIYNQLIKSSVIVIKDIRKVCFEESKMTEKQRDEIIRGIRPKLHTVNMQLRRLAFCLRYTTFLDVWYEITGHIKPATPKSRTSIIEACQLQWKRNAEAIKEKSLH